jgi:hypothetical protein
MQNNDLTCTICLCDFKNTPEKHTYHPKCGCKVGIAYHPACINDLLESVDYGLKCTQCRKPIPKTDIHKFLIDVVNSEQDDESRQNIPKPPKCLQLTNSFLNFFRPVYNYCLKGGVEGDDNVKIIQPMMNIMFIIWFIYLHVQIHNMYSDKYNEMKDECNLNTTNTTNTDDYCNELTDYKAAHYAMSTFLGLLYIVICYSINSTFYGNVLEYTIFTLGMIIDCAIWGTLKKDGYNDFTKYPGLYLFIISLISLTVCLILIIILRSMEEINNKYKILPSKITSFIGYKFKNGDEYDNEADNNKKKEIQPINIEPDSYTSIDIN